ncbi:alpha/beta hydrolase [Sphingomonas crocodyli]|uniref:Alpha/beta hydrolase n=1 Tax=Sphingomonas crocodyli TaxID=1979270 RepID=A0A437M0G0_9SPHN|nr:alpha/beta hydrolase [Sphingomonas crocodyli]RVT91177.1 alpha/beta hydrolase [Sphingomonas crocodyli]
MSDFRGSHLVDPQLVPLLGILPKEFTADNLDALRQPFPAMPLPEELLAATTLEERTIPGLDGEPDVRLVLIRPKTLPANAPAVLNFHGGGYLIGRAEMSEASQRPIAQKLDCLIVNVDYRLAPENPYPAQINDGYAALKWLFENAADLGVDATRIGVMGDSAGGGLAAAMALLARDKGEYKLAFQYLVYPMLDDRTCTSSDPHPYAGEVGWNNNSNRFGWSALLGHEPGKDGVSPYAAPARAEDLSGLPPTFIMTAALDLFVEENFEYARRLLRAGVPTDFHCYPGAIHGFYSIPGSVVSGRAVAEGHGALARFFGA